MMLDIKKTWGDEGYGKDNPWENSINYVYKVAAEAGIDREVTDAIVTKFFMEIVGESKKYSLEGCTCGCQSDKSGTDAIHALLKRIKTTHAEIQVRKAELLSANINSMILAHITKQNKEYVDKTMSPFRLFDWKKSWVLNLFKGV